MRSNALPWSSMRSAPFRATFAVPSTPVAVRSRDSWAARAAGPCHEMPRSAMPRSRVCLVVAMSSTSLRRPSEVCRMASAPGLSRIQAAFVAISKASNA
ncbi:hypothetical protein WY02_15560 [Pseudonocardia sp. AL041005-10]|nr:hypothetical protein WY02_15560 [Pseudonocardia sp. AL041005-10]